MLFARRSDIRMIAGYVLDYLAQAVAFSNHAYFKKSQTAQLEELQQLDQTGKVPEGFCDLYLSVIKESDVTMQKEKCHQAIQLVHEYLEEAYSYDAPKEHNYQDLADWYAELSYTWLRRRHYAGEHDYVKREAR